MQIRAAEISDIIREQIKEYEKQLEVRETGMVLSCGDGIARIYGLDKAAAGELIEFPRSEERRVGKEWRFRWAEQPAKKKRMKIRRESCRREYEWKRGVCGKMQEREMR